ncbi:MAG TPA: hypothetical protein VFD77_05205 [Brumimicrobium sp.]|nr:hypothetical protein [Brumimicrobium sp.]
MKSKNKFIVILFMGFSFFSYSQYQYSLEVSSFKGEHPKTVYDDFGKYLDIHTQSIKDSVFFFESKRLYTEDNFKEISEANGYTVKTFKLLSDRNQEILKEDY